MNEPRKLRRSMNDRKVGGVCAGLAKFFSIDSTVMRVGFAVFTVFTLFTGIILYLVLWMVIPSESYQDTL
ncbi:PspC domain-containing protein [Bacteroides sp. ET71]|uniref:PspC domain-containing protein n=1 Tax=Bacteroides sp. ET71 TaxID=2939421 RepID=UPI002011C3C4|nr:PspC domain-containing protein [Bacteroides sp. ET71]MCL1616863.1 PspC domain-containing protein [Bacteroides sp. ET71]